jgi:hypothetical protein
VASPLRFRRSTESWSRDRVDRDLYQSLDGNLGARRSDPRIDPPPGFEAVRFDMDDGSMALFCWDGDAYWLGNTETPSALWRTDKDGFDEAPYPVARWGQRTLQADLVDEDPWLAAYDYVSWFFLPVLFSKDGRETTREFFREHAAGVPDADRDEGLAFYESVLSTGALDDDRYVMAAKLGTSEYLDRTRMDALMGELDAAKLLIDAGYRITPEIEVTTGHSIDYRAERDGRAHLVEVTRPIPPARRTADTAVRAVRETGGTKAAGQLSEHGGGVTMFVDCTSFRDDEWAAVRGEQPAVRHRPAVVFRCRPDGRIEGYRKGAVPLDLDAAVAWI